MTTHEPSRAALAQEIIQRYIGLGDFIRLNALPEWVTSDLNVSQLKAIVLLEYHGAQTVGELARLLRMGNPSASILVQGLVEHGLVERLEDPTDRRRTIVRVTAEGGGLIAGRREYIRAAMLRWINQLSDEELTGLHLGLTALMGLVQAEKAAEKAAKESPPV